MTDLPRAEALVVQVGAEENAIYVATWPDPERGRPVVSFSAGWNEDTHPLGPTDTLTILPAARVADVVEALNVVGGSELSWYARLAIGLQERLREWTANVKLRWYWHVTRRL